MEENTTEEAIKLTRFQTLVHEGNFLGAWAVLKSGHLAKADEAIWVGELANAVQQAASDAKQRNDAEKLALSRSILSWILRDFPGLGSLYREQIRSPNPFIPQEIHSLWQDFSDLLSGRKSFDEDFKQKMDDAVRFARQHGTDVDTFAEIAREAEKALQKGVSGVGDFIGGLFESEKAAEKGRERKGGKESAAAQEHTGPVLKVKIQDANDPLPKNIHRAGPTKKTEK